MLKTAREEHNWSGAHRVAARGNPWGIYLTDKDHFAGMFQVKYYKDVQQEATCLAWIPAFLVVEGYSVKA